ncbi:hypothetical protein BH24ACT15_BH24ACT15_36000 [soil metagenome]
MGEHRTEVTKGEPSSEQRALSIESIGAKPYVMFGASGSVTISDAQLEAVVEADAEAVQCGRGGPVNTSQPARKGGISVDR